MTPFVIVILGLVFLSGFSGWFFSKSKPVEKPVKVMLFVLYFWASFFVQLMVFSVLYYFGLLNDYI